MKKILLALVAVAMMATLNAQTIFSEGFDNGIPSNWTLYNDNNTPHFASTFTDAWVSYDYGNPAPCALTTSYFTEAVQADRWMITPAITIPAGGYTLLFDAFNFYTSYPETLIVKISTTTTDKSAFTTVFSQEPGGDIDEYSVNLDSYAGQTIYVAFVDQSTDKYAMGVDNVTVKVIPDYEIVATAGHIATYVGQGVDAYPTVTVKNKGAQDLTSFDAYYVVDGGTPIATEHVSGINVAYNGTYTYTFTTAFNETVEGAHTIDIYVSNPNDNTDNVTDNMVTVNTNVYDAANAFPRTTLLEHFTTAKCPNCPSADERIETAIEGRSDIIWMSHHAGYYTDPMTQDEDETLCDFYNDNGGTYAPAAMLDRRVDFGDEATTPVFFPDVASSIVEKFDAAVAVPAFSNIDISNVNFNSSNRVLSFSVNGTAAELTNPRLTIYFMEDSILNTQSGVSGKMHHMHVFRDAINDVWGESIQLGAFSKDVTWQVPEDFKVHKCKIVAFVGEYNSSNILDRAISNATVTPYINAPYVGIDEVSAGVVMNVYPNPTTAQVNINAAETMREVRIINAIGQEVYTNTNVNAETLQVNTENMAAGMYMVSVKTDNGMATTRLSVVR